nr:C-type lectin domain family 4 member A-like isoform X4 [Myodes glareolus]XP_048300226.1 C-type lectin domain family 4 member A-like isoform X4 [Myodes glareolus]XP_048300228.1 C-type lectin domain family 4 member A-like isoform X4 [Myodes glareolus]
MALFLLLAISFLVAFIFTGPGTSASGKRRPAGMTNRKFTFIRFLGMAWACLHSRLQTSKIEVYFQKYSQILEEKKAIKDLTHTELNCKNNPSHVEDKVWSCCPKDWKPFSSHCYFIPTDSATWSKSQEKCSSMGAHLMVVRNREEQDFITKILRSDASYFIGLRDRGKRQWQWVDQMPYNESATFWRKGEPNSDREQCVIINHSLSEWGWNDIVCSNEQKSVCQMKKIYL